MTRLIDYNELASFISVIESGSYAEASRALGVPANTLSRRVQSLESALGVRLIHRSTRQMAMTPAGRLLFDHCKDATDKMASASRMLAAKTQSAAGTLRIAAPVDFFDFFNAAWLDEFLGYYQDLRLELLLSDRNVNLIGDRIDVALRRGNLVSSGLVAKRLATNHHLLVASPVYLGTRGRPTAIEQLADHACVITPTADGRNLWRLHTAYGIEEVVVQGRVGADNRQAMRNAALGALGIALVPEALVRADLAAGRLQRVLHGVHHDGGGLHAVFVGGGPIPLAASLFATFVGDKLRADHAGTVQQLLAA
ncbi:LysR family transcriptional regulator [Ideonella margarita]|uniref:LysR family transcriptional regulator n=1 Tax=Ideonella margarita TaxID=2984191 RepID=A0ABU9C7C7_9BURK